MIKKTMNNKIVAIVIGALFLSGSFYAGMKYGQGSVSSSQGIGGNFKQGQFDGISGNGARPGTRATSGGIVSGEVLSKDDKSITVKLRNGGSSIVILAPSTSFMKSTAGTLADIPTGKQVIVTGIPNSDGSVTAQTVQVRPDVVPPMQQ